MRKNTRLFLPLITTCLLAVLFLYKKYDQIQSPKYYFIPLNVPQNGKEKYHLFTEDYLLSVIKNKKKIEIELDADELSNQKKLELIQYEARKLKFTKDTNNIVYIHLTNETKLKDVINLIRLSYEDKHKRFVLFQKRFIIFGEYPEPKIDSTKIIRPIYM